MKLDNGGRLARPRAAYVHIPFCISKCHYCDFNSYPGLETFFDSYTRAIIREIEQTAADTETVPDDALDTVYFGGGTPTILDAGQLGEIFGAVDKNLHIRPDAEVTLEANPGTVDLSKLERLRGLGFNRLSLGVQSLDDEFLALIGRAHSAEQARAAYRAAREAGFDNVGIDLIFALPGQSLRHWERTLEQAVELHPEHLSLYELTIEEGTRFAEMCAGGELELPDEDDQLAMYEMAIEKITSAGYEHYEVSNFALPGYWSMHNQVYWRNEPYFGFGAGATSYVNGERLRRVENPRTYISAVESGGHAVESSECLEGRALLAETVIQGLRMLQGIDMYKIRQETGTSIAHEFAPEVSRLRDRGLVEIDGNYLRVTRQGLLLLNDVAGEFVRV